MIATAVEWVQVRCPWCGVVLCEVAPPSAIRVTCRRCRLTVERPIPA